jgi:hypothetical protein
VRWRRPTYDIQEEAHVRKRARIRFTGDLPRRELPDAGRGRHVLDAALQLVPPREYRAVAAAFVGIALVLIGTRYWGWTW